MLQRTGKAGLCLINHAQFHGGLQVIAIATDTHNVPNGLCLFKGQCDRATDQANTENDQLVQGEMPKFIKARIVTCGIALRPECKNGIPT